MIILLPSKPNLTALIRDMLKRDISYHKHNQELDFEQREKLICQDLFEFFLRNFGSSRSLQDLVKNF